MDLKTLTLNKTREKLLPSKNVLEDLSKLPSNVILELLKMSKIFEPLLKTFEKVKLHYEIKEENNTIIFALCLIDYLILHMHIISN